MEHFHGHHVGEWAEVLQPVADKDYYGILGVSKDASKDEIRRAYRTLVRKHHPDRNQGDAAGEERLKEINEAYGVLGDPEKKKAYDARRKASCAWSSTPYPAYGVRESMAALRHGRSLASFFRWIHEGSFMDDLPFVEQCLDPWFGFMERAPMSSKKSAGIKGPSIEVHIEVAHSRVPQGEARWVSYRVEGRVEEVLVRIPPHVGDGARLRMAGRGAPSPHGGPPGDLYVVVHVVADA